MNILTDTQKKVLAFFSEKEIMQRCYLAGGTALSAYYYFHRLSDDLDFFTEEPFSQRDEILPLIHELKQEIEAKEMRYQRLYDRHLYFFSFDSEEELKMEFSFYPFPALSPRQKHNGILIDSLEDIAAGKLMAMLDRFDPKDFVDMYFLLQDFSLDEIRSFAEKKFDLQIDDVFLGSELLKAEKISALPVMNKPLSKEEMKDCFFEKVKALQKAIIEE